MMPSMQYLLGKKKAFDPKDDLRHGPFSLFISAFNESARVAEVYKRVDADRKIWIALSEYGYCQDNFPEDGEVVFASAEHEEDYLQQVAEKVGKELLQREPVCIDITGMMRQQVVFLLKYFKFLGAEVINITYAEPNRYGRREHTIFSQEDVSTVRQVVGFEGTHDSSVNANDCLVVGVGYDHTAIARTLISKERARIMFLHSLPSLSADMYQESMLCLNNIGERSKNVTDRDSLYASANDPFVVASVLSEKVGPLLRDGSIANLYLSPLATKPQALGFALFYIRELETLPASILLPISRSYARRTGEGVGLIWNYEIRL